MQFAVLCCNRRKETIGKHNIETRGKTDKGEDERDHHDNISLESSNTAEVNPAVIVLRLKIKRKVRNISSSVQVKILVFYDSSC